MKKSLALWVLVFLFSVAPAWGQTVTKRFTYDPPLNEAAAGVTDYRFYESIGDSPYVLVVTIPVGTPDLVYDVLDDGLDHRFVLTALNPFTESEYSNVLTILAITPGAPTLRLTITIAVGFQ